MKANGLRKTFIFKCQSDVESFEKVIKKPSIDNFSKDYDKKMKSVEKFKKLKFEEIYFDVCWESLEITRSTLQNIVLPDNFSTIVNVSFG